MHTNRPYEAEKFVTRRPSTSWRTILSLSHPSRLPLACPWRFPCPLPPCIVLSCSLCHTLTASLDRPFAPSYPGFPAAMMESYTPQQTCEIWLKTGRGRHQAGPLNAFLKVSAPPRCSGARTEPFAHRVLAGECFSPSVGSSISTLCLSWRRITSA